MKTLLKVLLLTSIVAFQLKCGSNSGTTTAAVSYYASNGVCYSSAGSVVSSTYCSSTGYTLSNGICYSSAGTVVATTYCSSTTTGYTYSNGVCYSTSTGTVVATTYCTTSTSTTAQSCTGSYYYCPYGISAGLSNCQLGYCYVTNCRGYTLYTSAGTAVVCQ